MSGSLDTSDILVVVDKGDSVNINLQPPDQYGVSIKSGDTYVVHIDLPTTITTTRTDTYYRVADFALTASYVSGSQNSWDGLLGKPSGLISSSTQVDYNQIQNTPIPNVTASYIDYADVANKPTLVSSSTQILDYGIFATTTSNTFHGNQIISGGLTIALPEGFARGQNENPTSNNIFWSYVPQDINTDQVQVGWTATIDGGGTYTVTDVQVNTPFIYITLSDPLLQLGYRTFINFTQPAKVFNFNSTGLTFPDNTTQSTAFAGIPDGTVSSSQQVVTAIDNQNIAPAEVTVDQLNISTNVPQVSTTVSSSLKSGIYAATEIIYPPISAINFRGVSVEYNAQRISGTRSGILLASWTDDNISYTDVSNTEIGDTDDLSFNFIRSGNDILLRAYSAGIGVGDWTVQFLFKMFPNLL